jgi:hypothetical protein
MRAEGLGQSNPLIDWMTSLLPPAMSELLVALVELTQHSSPFRAVCNSFG